MSASPGRLDAQTIISACEAYGLDIPDDVERVMHIEQVAYAMILERIK